MMRNSKRYVNALKEVSTYSEKEKLKIERTLQKREERLQKKSERIKNIEASTSYGLIKSFAKYFDEWGLDGFIGLFCPEIGDVITSTFPLPFYWYVTLFKVHSISLTLAVTLNFILDTLIGLYPAIGDVLDFFHKAYKRNNSMIKNYVEGDEKTIKLVRKSAVWMAIAIVIIGLLIYWLWKFAVKASVWLYGVISSLLDYITSLF